MDNESTAGDDPTWTWFEVPADVVLHRPRDPALFADLLILAKALYDDFPWRRFVYVLLSYAYFLLLGCLAVFVLPLVVPGATPNGPDRVPMVKQDLNNYFGSFHGFSECNVRATDLYIQPDLSTIPKLGSVWCVSRKSLLESMSYGGRVGFDAPYSPRGCNYRWYTVSEICMILGRFTSVVFIGDDSLQTIYNGFNILLRQDLTSGALKTWDMDKASIQQCRCDNQFFSQTCSKHFVTMSEEVTKHGHTPYSCPSTPHAFLRVDTSPAPRAMINKLRSIVLGGHQSHWKASPIIHSLSPGTGSTETAIKSMLEFSALGRASASKRRMPMLWVGPTAAGHVDIKDRKGNQEIWDFDQQVGNAAIVNGIEALKMYNLTVQAGSWDGLRFGEKVAITQAMMVVNWLSRIRSS